MAQTKLSTSLVYGDFEGTISKGQAGGGTVMLWDRVRQGRAGRSQDKGAGAEGQKPLRRVILRTAPGLIGRSRTWAGDDASARPLPAAMAKLAKKAA